MSDIDLPQLRKDYHASIKYRRDKMHIRWPHWHGYLISKYPTDLLLYQKLIFQLRPSWLVETGTKFGGSALFFAHMFDLVKKGKVISVDVNNDLRKTLPQHPRITYLTGNSVDPEIIKKIKWLTRRRSVMVTLDSNHHYVHVKKELDLYKDIVTAGHYLIVEDTIMGGYKGPKRPIRPFLDKYGKEFECVPWEEKTILSQNVGGWLRKIK